MKKPNLPKPEPMELAKLAAILCPNAEPGVAMDIALEKAMKFYVNASLFIAELPNDSGAWMRYASDEHWRERYILPQLRTDLQKARADTLELDPAKDNDPARQYLAERGLKDLKKARTVLDNFRRCYSFLPEDRSDVENMFNGWKRMKDGRTVYYIPRFALDSMANFKKTRRAEQQERSRQTLKTAKTHAEKTGKEKKKQSSVGRVR